MSPEEFNHTHHEVLKDTCPEIQKDRHAPRSCRWWVGGWTSALLVAGGTLAWCLIIYFLIGNRPPGWQYGVVPYVPGESVLSSQPPPRNAPNQVILPQKTNGGANANR